MSESHNPRDNSSSLVDIAIADHRTVQKLLVDLREADEVGALRRCLSDLKAFAERHFAIEEAPEGLYEAIALAAPHFQRRIEAVRAQHGELLAEIEAFLDALAGDALPEGARERADALVRAISAHESEENNLHAEALYTEIGVGD